MGAEDTLPKLILRNYERYGDKRVAMRKKIYGIWQEYTWKEYYEKVKYFSLGLVSLGIESGDKVAIVGDNDPEWYWAEFATQAAGGVPVAMWTDALPAEIKYLASTTDVKFAVAKDQEQVDKFLEVKDELPKLRKVIYWEAKGLVSYEEPLLTSFAQVVELGREEDGKHPGLFEQMVGRVSGDDYSVILFTSGTTGAHPKAGLQTYNSLSCTTISWLQMESLNKTYDYLSYITPTVGGEQFMGMVGHLIANYVVNFIEEPETMQTDMKEISPQVMVYISRMWESLISTMRMKINDSGFLKRLSYNLFLPVGYKLADLKEAKKKPNLVWQALYQLAYLTVFRPLCDKHGLARIKMAYTSGTGMSPQSFRLLRGIGLNLKQMYGSNEAGLLAIHRDDDVKFETVGPPLPNIELKISDEGEVLVRTRSLMPGYYNNPEASQETLRGGWFHTGDAGYLNEEGHLIIVGRLGQLSELPDGQRYSPQYIEQSLRFNLYIREAMVIGGVEGKPYVTAIINVDFDITGKWAETHHLSYTTLVDLSQKEEVNELVYKGVEWVNRLLPLGARIKRYVVLHKEFDPDEAELTRTGKIRRGFMIEQYQGLIDAMYRGEKEVVAEAKVRYRDGRSGKVTVPIKIRSVKEEAG